MGCHGYYAISHNHNELIIGEYNFLPLRGLILPFDANKRCSYGFNVDLITHWGTSLSNGFVLRFKFSLKFMNMQMRSFSYIWP